MIFSAIQPLRAIGQLNLLSRAIIPLALAILIGCRPPNHLQLKLDPDVVKPAKSAVIFLVDGMDLTRLDELLAAGELPNIKKRFVDGGVRVRHAVSSLPSVTYANCTSLITGVFPSHHGIVGNFWFDRRTLSTYSYMAFDTYRTVNQHFTSPTIYELLDDHFTLNLQNHTRRGVTETIDNRAMFGLSWFFQGYKYADRHVGLKFEEVAQKTNRVKRWPSIIMTYYPGVDEIGHRHGSQSAEYRSALTNIDAVVGLVTNTIERAGPAESTYYVLMTDHGHVPVPPEKRMDMRGWLIEHRRMRIRSEPLHQREYTDRLEVLRKYDAVGGLDQDREARFYLRGARGWAYPVEPAEIKAWIETKPALTDVPAVQFVLYRVDADRVCVLGRDGTVRLERKRDQHGTAYRLVNERGDPLGYDAEFARGWHSSREWLIHTAESDYPDFVPQAAEMFDSPHIGDVVLLAGQDWSFCPTQKGGHGSCLPRDMNIPLFFAGPDLPGGTEIGPGRLVDVMPTIVGLLGEESRLKGLTLDGINLADELRKAHTQTQRSRCAEPPRF